MWWIYVCLTVLIALAYTGLILYVIYKWKAPQIPGETTGPGHEDLTFSFIIPARNEALHIADCLNAIVTMTGFEDYRPQVIVVDDHSEDRTAEIVFGYPRVTLLRLADHIGDAAINSYKKAAVAYALQHATGAYIIQTDADCILPENYLVRLSEYLARDQPDLVAAPVFLAPARTWLEKFQSLDMMAMMALTKAGIDSGLWHMANGANLVYRNTPDGPGRMEMASGDDIHRIETFAMAGKKIRFIRDRGLIVQTPPLSDIKSLFYQRLRWGSKNRYSSNAFIKAISAMVYVNALLIGLHLTWMTARPMEALILLGFHLYLKLTVEYVLLRECVTFYGKPNYLNYFPLLSILQWLYILIIGSASLFIHRYEWKGRRVQ